MARYVGAEREKHCTSEGRHYSYAEWYGAAAACTSEGWTLRFWNGCEIAARPLLNGIAALALRTE